MRLPVPEPSFSETVQIGIVVRDLDATMRRSTTARWLRKQVRGREAVLSGTFSDFRVAYLPTEHDLGVIVEIFSDDRVPEQKTDAS